VGVGDRQPRRSEAADGIADERGGRQIKCGNQVDKNVGEGGR
jgi:hypothetical protein